MILTGAAFLFGSGISIESGAPTVEGITSRLLRGGWKPHYDWRFEPCDFDLPGRSIGAAKLAQDFLLILKKHLDSHFAKRKYGPSNYEHLYSFALQLLDDESGEGINPLIAPFAAMLKKEAASIIDEIDLFMHNGRFASLLEHSTSLIQWSVYHSLVGASRPVSLEAITEVADQVDDMDIFSLNHDLLIESELDRCSHSVVDGFTKQSDSDASGFDGEWNENGNAIRLLKLHGSINWYRCLSADHSKVLKVRHDPDCCRGENGKRIRRLDLKPQFLTGTSSKETRYGRGIFNEIFCAFHRRLAKHRNLICCGYGWADKGINYRILEWLNRDTSNRLILLYNRSFDELHQMLSFFPWEWLDAEKKIVWIESWLKKTIDFAPYFDKYHV